MTYRLPLQISGSLGKRNYDSSNLLNALNDLPSGEKCIAYGFPIGPDEKGARGIVGMLRKRLNGSGYKVITRTVDDRNPFARELWKFVEITRKQG